MVFSIFSYRLQFEHFMDYLLGVLNVFLTWSRLHNFWRIFSSRVFYFFQYISNCTFCGLLLRALRNFLILYTLHILEDIFYLSWVLNPFWIWSRLHNFWRVLYQEFWIFLNMIPIGGDCSIGKVTNCSRQVLVLCNFWITIKLFSNIFPSFKVEIWIFKHSGDGLEIRLGLEIFWH